MSVCPIIAVSPVRTLGFKTYACIKSPGGLVKTDGLPPVCDSVGLEEGLRIFVSKKFLGDTDAAGPGTIL